MEQVFLDFRAWEWDACNTGPIKVNLEFNFSFSGFSFLGLDPNIYSDFKPEIHFIFQFQFQLISK